MNIAQMREAIKTLYPGPRWAERVDEMSEAQIYRIYREKFVEAITPPVLKGAPKVDPQLKLDI